MDFPELQEGPDHIDPGLRWMVSCHEQRNITRLLNDDREISRVRDAAAGARYDERVRSGWGARRNGDGIGRSARPWGSYRIRTELSDGRLYR